MATQLKVLEAYIELGVRDPGAIDKALDQAKDKLKKAGKGIDTNKLLGEVAKLFGSGGQLGRLSQTLQTIAKSAGGGEAGGGLGQLAGTLGGLAKAAGIAAVAVAGVTVAIGVAKAAFAKMIELASKANPVAAERYQLAWEDLQAAIGRIFIPVLEFATEVVRYFADLIFSELSDLDMDAVVNEWREVFEGLKPVIWITVQSIKLLGVALLELHKATGLLLWGPLGELIKMAKTLNALQRALGLEGAFEPRKSSMGISQFGGIQFQGVAEASKQFQIDALRASLGVRTHEERQTSLLEQIKDALWKLVGKPEPEPAVGE
jgi:hypothetical protein